jgi:hypothetical protein
MLLLQQLQWISTSSTPSSSSSSSRGGVVGVLVLQMPMHMAMMLCGVLLSQRPCVMQLRW